MFTPFVFLILAAAWAIVVVAFIARRLYQLNQEVQLEEQALEEQREWALMILGWKPRDVDATISAVSQMEDKARAALAETKGTP